jgi:hypothetical protein
MDQSSVATIAADEATQRAILRHASVRRAARELRADLHRGVAAVLDEITVRSTDPDTPAQLAAAMEALREEVPIGPPC